MDNISYDYKLTTVALLTECVDRNIFQPRYRRTRNHVALLTECVDRNPLVPVAVPQYRPRRTPYGVRG